MTDKQTSLNTSKLCSVPLFPLIALALRSRHRLAKGQQVATLAPKWPAEHQAKDRETQ